MLYIQVLGPVWVSAEGGDVELGPPKQRAVLALLGLHADRHVRLAEIVESVWSTDPPAKSHALIHTYIARLRHILEPGVPRRNRTNVIASVPGGYRLVVNDDQLDLAQFRSLTARANALRQAGHREQAFEVLGRAIQLWRDPELTDLQGLIHPEDLLSLRQEFVNTALDCLALGLEIDQPQHLVPLAERLARAEPLNERIQARTLQVLARGGMRADAMVRFFGISSRLRTELGIDPGPELSAAYREVLEPEEPTGTVPAARTPWRGPRPRVEPLLGREGDLDFATGLIRRYRLVTLTGPAGVGKTTLALQVAAGLHASFAGGVAVADLTTVRGRAELPGAMLRSFTGTETTQEPAEARRALLERLQDSETLLVLDNAELVTDEIADLVDELLRTAPRLRVLVTTRELLGLASEAVYPVRPLTVDPDGPDGPPSPAVELFARRAAQVCPEFTMTPSNAKLVSDICRAIDGLPLAIELAAACLRTSNLESLLDDLHDPLHAIHPPRRGGPSHHRSLHAAVSRNLDLLDPAEQRCFAALGAVPREFCLATAARVGILVGRPASDIRLLLERLVDKSLLEVWHRQDGPQYRMLGTVHAYARELLHGYRSL